MDEPRIIKKSRGVNLIYQGYQYCKDKTAPNGKTYWRCTKRPRGSCSARVHTTGDEQHIRVVHSIPHDHEPDIESVAVDKMKSDLSTLSASNPTVISVQELCQNKSESMNCNTARIYQSIYSVNNST